MTCPYRNDVAAMVLNALQPQESARLHAHLADCARCGELLAEFGALPFLLALVRRRHAPAWLRGSSPGRRPGQAGAMPPG